MIYTSHFKSKLTIRFINAIFLFCLVLTISNSLQAQSWTDTVWVEDATPAGATRGGNGETWTWISANPTPFSGTAAHQSNIVAGLHNHYFNNATETLTVTTGDVLFAYVYLDPSNMPREVTLQWSDGAWGQNAYWGENLISTTPKVYMGPLPAAGQWVRLEVAAS
jgi:hypothetical protein